MTEIVAKTCKRCGEFKPLSDFSPNKLGRDGRRPDCRECRKEYQRIHKKRTVAQRSQYRKANRERLAESKKQWRRNNPDKECVSKVQYRAENKARIAAQNRAYAQANPDVGRVKAQRRRARLNACAINDFTKAQWRDLLRECENKCFYCGIQSSDLHIEHMIPISRGGNHTLSNIVPACLICNSRKGTKTAEEFMAS